MKRTAGDIARHAAYSQSLIQVSGRDHSSVMPLYGDRYVLIPFSQSFISATGI